MSKHTPGPWVITSDPNHELYTFISQKDVDKVIARITTADSPSGSNRANAQLIAAAPDMLEALKQMVQEMELSEWDCPAMIRAKAAIAKAESNQ